MSKDVKLTTPDENSVQESVLVVEDDPGLQKQMRWSLSPYNAEVVGSRSEALEKIASSGPFRIVLLDLGLPPDPNGASEGLRALDEILGIDPHIKVIVVSGNVTRSNAVRAVARGAFDFVTKPIDIDVLKHVIDRGLRMYALERENESLRERHAGALHGLVFASKRMSEIAQMIEQVGPMDVSVLLVGETGTGKDVVARALHAISGRKNEAFVAINCASIPENLLESELFGHERGAFTGAVKRTLGKFELADKGTLFLDEIGDMPLGLQVKLLRFIQERKLERVGGRESISVDVRLICATNQKLEESILEKKFREDLFYRINDVRIELPPLRERAGDTVLLAQHFLDTFNRAYYKRVTGFSEDAIKSMAAHPWPGNVRELENKVKRAVIMSKGKRITGADLDLEAATPAKSNFDLKTEVEKLQRKLASEAMIAAGGNVSKAAKLLGISRPLLYSLLEDN